MAEFAYNNTVSATTGITPLLCFLWTTPTMDYQTESSLQDTNPAYLRRMG